MVFLWGSSKLQVAILSSGVAIILALTPSILALLSNVSFAYPVLGVIWVALRVALINLIALTPVFYAWKVAPTRANVAT